jgi:hypothetical protein
MRIACLPKASVAIHVNGSALQEYEVESEYRSIANSYVETVHGAEFSVLLKLGRNFTPRDKQLVCNVSLDGQGATSHLLYPEDLERGVVKCIDSARDDVDGISYYRKFTFRQI